MLIPVDDSVDDDAQMASLFEKALEESSDLRRIVGQTSMALRRATCLDAPMDDLQLAAVARATGTAIAFSNGWLYGAPIPPGPFTAEDLWNMVLVNSLVFTADITGDEILEMMEENIERTFSCDPFSQRSGYLKRFRRLTNRAKLENPKMLSIEIVACANAPLEHSTYYKVGFITAQRVPSQFGRNRKNLPSEQSWHLKRGLLIRNGEIKALKVREGWSWCGLNAISFAKLFDA